MGHTSASLSVPFSFFFLFFLFLWASFLEPGSFCSSWHWLLLLGCLTFFFAACSFGLSLFAQFLLFHFGGCFQKEHEWEVNLKELWIISSECGGGGEGRAIPTSNSLMPLECPTVQLNSEDSVRFHRLRAQSHQTVPLFRPSQPHHPHFRQQP